ncbi:unnamed protein product [Psylliodes chrysocephalus]|uniref:BESS domain-containing protein n=1 Tax=Psylliodes chrysocephalus TaxID=3402493 RepID=A0A9P0GHU1_9CUCU|nr:unnamed protein product [Psylliodes chrysocephala]
MEEFKKLVCPRIGQKEKEKSGDGSSWKTYVFFKQLSFLMRCSANRETTSNFASGNSETAEAPKLKENDGFANKTATLIHKRKKNPSRTDDDLQIGELFKKSIEQRQKNEMVLDNDADRHFLLSFLPDFKKVPDDKKMDLKMVIIQSIKSAQLTTQAAFTPYNYIQPLTLHFSSPNPLPQQNVPTYSLSQHFSDYPSSATPSKSSRLTSSQRINILNPTLSPYSINSSSINNS